MGELPNGTVTLLFTDIEGSTRLLQRVGERYADVLEACRHLQRMAFHQYHGHEVDTQGDAFFVAFAQATDAVSAAIAAQRTLYTHVWPDGVTVGVRMGIHTGQPALTAEGYVGLDVHHAARITSAAHGGQVLLSQTTRELVEHDLPDGVLLRDLGEHRLKDLQHKTRLFQLVIAGLADEFPPLMTLDTHPNNLPVQPTPLIGREQEVAAVLRLLSREEVRLVTLTGPGGIGKTRLGLQVAAEFRDAFPDGVYFVNLAPISDPTFVVSTIAQTLELKESGDQSLLDLLQGFLQDKQLLLLLDNFEQVLNVASQLAELLAACPKLKVLVTSRFVLHLRGEQEFTVPPLQHPDPKHLPDLAVLSQYEAVELFIARAQAVKPEFQLTTANAPIIAEICTRLDGLPLAIELAAARSKLLPPQALLARLGQSLTVLTGGAQDAPARQQTLRHTIDWSYELLPAQEQRLFRRLSVFAGGCTLEAIEATCAMLESDSPVGQVLDSVASLLDKSLLQQREQEGEEPRFLMLETIREYGLEALEVSGGLEVTRQAHADYYLALAEDAEPELAGPQQALWLERLEREHDNLRVAMEWAVEQGEAGQSKEIALRLCAALGWYWFVHDHLSEGRKWMEWALTESEGAAAPVRGKVLSAAGLLAFEQGDYGRAEALCGESLITLRELGDKVGLANSLHIMALIARARGNYTTALTLIEESLAFSKMVDDVRSIAYALDDLAYVALQQGEYARARSLTEEALARFRKLGDKRGIAYSLKNLGRVIFNQGDPTRAYTLLQEGLALFREVGDKQEIAVLLNLLGQVAILLGDHTTARLLLEEGLAISKEMGDSLNIATGLFGLGRLAFCQSDHTVARTLYMESLAIFRALDVKEGVASCLEGVASVVMPQGESTWAAQLWGAAETLREAVDAPISPVYRADYERSVAAANAQLGEQAFAAAWAEGRTMTPEQALAAQDQPILSTAISTRQVSSHLSRWADRP